jgi:hypothetical protein
MHLTTKDTKDTKEMRKDTNDVPISPSEVLRRLLDEIGDALNAQGVTLEELMESGRAIRGTLLKDMYGIDAGDDLNHKGIPMNTHLKTSMWRQFGAAIDYLAETMRACPEGLWTAALWDTHAKPAALAQFWYVAYHTLFWLDLYLTGAEEGFVPPAPFTLIEQDEDGPLPERVYTKAELQDYLAGCRARCQATIMALTDEAAERECAFGWGTLSFFELVLYNLRHVHGHAAQLNMLLGQNGVPTADYPSWVGQVRG